MRLCCYHCKFPEGVALRCSVKMVFLKISQKSKENTCVRVSFLTKLSEACNFVKKEAIAQVFPCEFSENFKNIFSCRTLPVAASCLLWISRTQKNLGSLKYLFWLQYFIIWDLQIFWQNITLANLSQVSWQKRMLSNSNFVESSLLVIGTDLQIDW